MKTVLYKFGRAVKFSGKCALWPLKKYIEFMAQSYGKMYGDKVQYINFGL